MKLDVAATGSRSQVAEELGHVRRDLRGLIALELLQRAIAVGSLVAIAAYAAVTTPDREVAASIALAVLVAIAYLAFAFRIRMGQELLRRDAQLLELREELEIRSAESLSLDPGGTSHPYRSSAVLQLPVAGVYRGGTIERDRAVELLRSVRW